MCVFLAGRGERKYPQRPEDRVRAFGAGVDEAFDPEMSRNLGSENQNSGPLEKKKEPLTAESCFQPLSWKCWQHREKSRVWKTRETSP